MNNADINLVGTGINMLNHLSPEAKEVLSKSRRIYHLTAFHDELSKLCPDVINWKQLYLETKSSSVYQTMAEVLIQEALNEPNVSFAVYGHPLILVDTSRIVIEKSIELDLNIRVVSGISSIDLLLSHLLLDVGLSGLQVYEPNQMVLKRILPNPHVACFIMQINSFGTFDLLIEQHVSNDRLSLLKNFLLQVYKPNHPIILITCPFLPDTEEIRYTTIVDKLDQVADVMHTGMSLYIPPAVQNKIDTEYIKFLNKESA